MEYIYWYFNGKNFNYLKKGLHDVLLPCHVIILIALFCNIKNFWEFEEWPQNIIP
jgi:hypothetical protein